MTCPGRSPGWPALASATIEPFDLLADPAGLAAAMKATGLRAITAHARATGPDALALCEVATSLGIATLVVPWLDAGAVRDP